MNNGIEISSNSSTCVVNIQWPLQPYVIVTEPAPKSPSFSPSANSLRHHGHCWGGQLHGSTQRRLSRQERPEEEGAFFISPPPPPPFLAVGTKGRRFPPEALQLLFLSLAFLPLQTVFGICLSRTLPRGLFWCLTVGWLQLALEASYAR